VEDQAWLHAGGRHGETTKNKLFGAQIDRGRLYSKPSRKTKREP